MDTSQKHQDSTGSIPAVTYMGESIALIHPDLSRPKKSFIPDAGVFFVTFMDGHKTRLPTAINDSKNPGWVIINGDGTRIHSAAAASPVFMS